MEPSSLQLQQTSVVLMRPQNFILISLQSNVSPYVAATRPVTVRAQVLRDDGNLEVITRVATEMPSLGTGLFRFDISSGVLLSLTAYCTSSTAIRAYTYGRFSLCEYTNAGYNAIRQIMAGWIYSGGTLSFPEHTYDSPSPIDIPPVLVDLGDPDPGLQIVYAIPDTFDWHLLAIGFTFTTSAAVANRVVRIAPILGGLTVAAAVSPVTQAASLSYIYTFMVGITAPGLVDTNRVMVNLPLMRFPVGSSIRTDIDLMDGNDDIEQAYAIVQPGHKILY